MMAACESARTFIHWGADSHGNDDVLCSVKEGR